MPGTGMVIQKIDRYLHDSNSIIICNDKNLYNIDNKTNEIEVKYNICQKFVYNKVVNYLDTIKNSNEIYIIDSCFTGIVLPYLKTNQLKASIVRIIKRDLVDKISFLNIPIQDYKTYRVEYGKSNTYIIVTSLFLSNYVNNKIINIPIHNSFNNIFGDPLPNKKKEVNIFRNNKKIFTIDEHSSLSISLDNL